MVTPRKRTYKSGKTVYFVDAVVDGKRVRQVIGSSKKLADQIAKDTEVKIIKESSDLYLKEISIKEFLKVIQEYNQTNLRAASAVRYKNALDNLEDFLGQRVSSSLSTVTGRLLEEYKTFAKTKREDNTINTEIKIFRVCFNHAVRWKYLRSNPANDVPMIRFVPKVPDTYSEEEISKILKISPPPFDDIFRLFLQTGMRKEELRHLEVKDVLFDRNQIFIRAKGNFIPKTAEGFIPMTSEARKILRKYCDFAQNGPVFRDSSGKMFAPRMFLDVIQRAAKRLNIANPTIHRLRHSFCTHLLNRGVDIEIIRQLARHAKIQTTQRYLHLRTEHLQSSIEKISGLGTPKARDS